MTELNCTKGKNASYSSGLNTEDLIVVSKSVKKMRVCYSRIQRVLR